MLAPLLLALVIGGTPAPSPSDSLRLDSDIRQVALRHAGEIRQCYESQGLRLNPQLAGTLELEVTVLPTGRVDSAAVSASALAGPGKQEVERCVVTAARQWRFDRGPYGTEIIVYPFHLSRDNRSILASRSS